ncbi:MAG TPA: hypothetical protein VFO05_07145 [Candidatus Limnocylindrales bacterium]|nr:hypothetical protein [Candidatus Limnocylindrales bacterium]
MAANPYFAPDYDISINGAPLSGSLRSSVSRVALDDGIGVADRLEVDFVNPDARLLQDHIRGLGFRPFPTGIKLGPLRADATASGKFDLDNKVEVSMGYEPGPSVKLFHGEITGIDAEFPSTGMPILRLVAHDYLHRLAEGKYARGFGPIPDFLIASILSVENLLIPLIDPAVAGASTAIAVVNYIFSGTGRKQKGQSDLDLLKEIADTYDAEFWAEGDFLYLSRFFKEYEPRLTLTWGQSLMSFTPRVTKIGQVAGVAAKFTLREIPLSFIVAISYDFDREAIQVVVVPGEAGSLLISMKTLTGPLLTLIRHPIGSPADIVNSALVVAHKLRTTINNRLTGTASAVGDPRIKAGAVVRIEGVGVDFSGDYRVVSARHVIDASGYRTDFKVRKEIIP